MANNNIQLSILIKWRIKRIAYHANPQITLKHYTHQVRDGAGARDKLNDAYGLN